MPFVEPIIPLNSVPNVSTGIFPESFHRDYHGKNAGAERVVDLIAATSCGIFFRPVAE